MWGLIVSEYTKEPWKHAQRAIAGLVDIYVGDYLSGRIERIGDVISVCNARRIVACVNACAGSSTDGLEAMVAEGRSVANMAMLYERAMDKRDTLLAAARKTLLDNLHLCDGDNCTLKALRDAVESVDGKPLVDDA